MIHVLQVTYGTRQIWQIFMKETWNISTQQTKFRHKKLHMNHRNSSKKSLVTCKTLEKIYALSTRIARTFLHVVRTEKCNQNASQVIFMGIRQTIGKYRFSLESCVAASQNYNKYTDSRLCFTRTSMMLYSAPNKHFGLFTRILKTSSLKKKEKVNSQAFNLTLRTYFYRLECWGAPFSGMKIAIPSQPKRIARGNLLERKLKWKATEFSFYTINPLKCQEKRILEKTTFFSDRISQTK